MKRVAVLRGGPSQEYDVSMRTGQAVLEVMRGLDYITKDIVVSRKGEWLHDGFVKDPETLLDTTDVVFLALHGAYGEDGQVQRILQRKNVPFTGSRAMPSAIAFNKELTKQTLRSIGLKMPRHRRVSRAEIDTLDEEIKLIFSEVGSELFVKPILGGSSIGARYTPTEETLKTALTELLEMYEHVMVEEYIRGKEATVGILNNFRNMEMYPLPVIEIVPPRSDTFYSNENKYNGTTKLLCPGRFSYHEKALLSEAAATVHKEIGCDQYSRSDFIVKDGDVYFLEINTLPGLTPHSNFPKAASSVGINFSDLISHLVETATV
ncbi:D-alanine--D-alanine ligase [Candidatus Nomurabacteria bacterium]|nr:D-alanine--D-alanine ligase [Candidatus Kaiserbacteria bacterium]MCB9815596.1 D-alanine--D-alanine ligase [Candidatus Nomurabacteria bacterium]